MTKKDVTRTVMTRSAQKKLDEQKLITKKPIGKPPLHTKPRTRASPVAAPSAVKNTRSSATPLSNQSRSKPVKAVASKKFGTIEEQLKKSSQPGAGSSTPKCRTPRAINKVPVNPESPMSQRSTKPQHQAGKGRFALMDTCDLQSQDSTSFEAQSVRCGTADVTVDQLPPLTQELANLPKMMLQEEKKVTATKKDSQPAQKVRPTKLNSMPVLIKSTSIAAAPIKLQPIKDVEEALPSVQLRTLLLDEEASAAATAADPVSQTAQSAATDISPAQDIAMENEPFDPHFCNIEETIDELERRVKAEEARYARLMANREWYEHWMDPNDYRSFMRQSATRLINFDPNFDADRTAPLPQPWQQQSPAMYLAPAYDELAYRSTSPISEFAYPQLPSRRHNY